MCKASFRKRREGGQKCRSKVYGGAGVERMLCMERQIAVHASNTLKLHSSHFATSTQFVLHTQQWPRHDLALYTSVLSRC